MGHSRALDAIAEVFCQTHPQAEPVHEGGMDGWAVKVQDAPEGWKGTMDPTRFMMFSLERRSGITVHLWDPRDPGLLKKNQDWLQDAGFKVMVGCLQWNRKAPVALDALERLFASTK